MLQNSYCLGEAGHESSVQLEQPPSAVIHTPKSPPDSFSNSEGAKTDKKKRNKKKETKVKIKQKLEEDKLKEALESEMEQQKLADKLLTIDERKRPYNSMYDVKAPTEEDMEAYYLKRSRQDDPMSQFM